MNKGEMLALAAKVEIANRADRALGREVLIVCGRGYVSPMYRWDNPTASLDAAMTLVSEDRRLHSLGETKNMYGGLWLALLTGRSGYHEGGIAGKGATAPLALTAAALCARAASMEAERGAG